jgi:lipopolysaccharide biosynthesis regulator YciM
LHGFNYPLNQQTNEALDIFIDAFVVNAKTFDPHMILAGLFSHRGEGGCNKALVAGKVYVGKNNMAKLNHSMPYY